MKKYFNLKSIILFLSVIFFMSSCKDDDKKNDDTANSPASTTTATTTNTTTEPVPKKATFAGNLDILRVGRKAFTDLPNGTKLVYSHNFGADDKVHLKGWVLVGNTFPGTSMELENVSASGETFDANTYFSNVVLMPNPNGFNEIRKALLDDPNYKYVLFIPYKVDTYFIGYHIYPSITGAFTNTEGFAPVADANPSPPKNY